ncbi:MAG: DUF5789 family protein [Halobacteriaceae archaeon]
MSEEENGESEELPYELSEDSPSVDGAPLGRVSSRLTWGIERSELIRKEGDTSIRTPNGPRSLESILENIDIPYFESQQEFETAVREEIGYGPVETAE